MTRPISTLYHQPLDKSKQRISTAISRGCESAGSGAQVFFRADDIGFQSATFAAMIDCFTTHKLPLCLATVPAWLNKTRLAELRRSVSRSSQWCWHQHGRLHHNFQLTGKKMEFGPDRSPEAVHNQLILGKKRLEALLQDDFQPFFTPPWNRCSGDTLQALADLGYQGISRSKGATPEPPVELPEFEVNVDLHTRKEPIGEEAFTALLTELESSLASGCAGIMLHHQRMNRRAFTLLDILLVTLKQQQVPALHFGDLIRID